MVQLQALVQVELLQLQDLLVSTGGSTVLGFSFTGGTVPAGCGTLTSLTLDGDATGLSGIVVSDPFGQSIPFDYFTIVSGCTDETACNYDSTATEDDGSCTFAEENFDCDGNYTGPTATVQIIHNSASPTVDVYVDGGLAISGFEYRTATGLLELPTSFTVGIAPTGGEVIADFPFELVDGGSYVVVATGLLGDTTTPFGLAAAATEFNQADATVVGLNVYHGSTDAPAVDIWADDAPLLTSFSYGDFSGPVEVPAADYTLGVAPAGGDIIAAYTAPLSGLGGGTAVVFASGFLSGDDPAFGLFAALTDGTVLTLPSLDQDCAGEWGGDAVVDECGECDGNGIDEGTCDCDGSLPSFTCEDGSLVCEELDCGPPEVTDGCELPMNNLYLMGGDVLYNSDTDIAGFQFLVDGTTASAANGGDAAAAGFTVSTGGTVLGFSFTGAVIPAGCGTLTSLSLDGDATGLSGIVVSDVNGAGLSFEYYAGPVIGCTDSDACNYNADAVWDDGTCEYPTEFCDCSGEPSDGYCDCEGSILDECGVCDGPGLFTNVAVAVLANVGMVQRFVI